MELINGKQFYMVDEVHATDILNVMHGVKVVRTRNRNREAGVSQAYYNCPVSFDTETTSITDPDESKHGILYLWQMDINGLCLYGRTMEEFRAFCDLLTDTLHLSEDKRLIIYVHNLGYEFQWMRMYFDWQTVFARESHKPMKAISGGLEFRCSYILSGYSLAKVAENLHSHSIRKLTENMDYSLIRTPDTDLTHEELAYALNDVQILEYYIAEEIERCGNISKIPLTQTGYVREYCKKACTRGKDWQRKRDKMLSMTIEEDEYEALKYAFQGGFTHASATKVGKVHKDVRSYDFASSYPAVMVAEEYPMSKGVKTRVNGVEDFDKLLNGNNVIFLARFTGIMAKAVPDHPISESKCLKLTNPIIDNGRVCYGEELIMWLTEVDYSYLGDFYDWDTLEIGTCWVYKKDYLPTDFIGCCLKLYEDKTTLKGVEGKEVEYMHGKQMLNSMYGMTVTDIMPEEVVYDSISGDWSKSKPASEMLEQYNNKKTRFLSYPWGVYVTAYARRNLMTGILACGDDYIYADTDSVKITNADGHQWYFDAYNRQLEHKLEKAMRHHGFDLERIRPKDIKGRPHTLGIWDFDGDYDEFKTLGAKRYMVREGNKYKLTVAGCAKKSAMAWIEQEAVKEHCTPFDLFGEGLVVPAGHSGRSISTYIDYPETITVTDYQGNTGTYHTPTCLHLSETEYSLNISDRYKEYLLGIWDHTFQLRRYG